MHAPESVKIEEKIFHHFISSVIPTLPKRPKVPRPRAQQATHQTDTLPRQEAVDMQIVQPGSFLTGEAIVAVNVTENGNNDGPAQTTEQQIQPLPANNTTDNIPPDDGVNVDHVIDTNAVTPR